MDAFYSTKIEELKSDIKKLKAIRSEKEIVEFIYFLDEDGHQQKKDIISIIDGMINEDYEKIRHIEHYLMKNPKSVKYTNVLTEDQKRSDETGVEIHQLIKDTKRERLAKELKIRNPEAVKNRYFVFRIPIEATKNRTSEFKGKVKKFEEQAYSIVNEKLAPFNLKANNLVYTLPRKIGNYVIFVTASVRCSEYTFMDICDETDLDCWFENRITYEESVVPESDFISEFPDKYAQIEQYKLIL